MSSSGKRRRNERDRRIAKAAHKLRGDGLTNHEIAEQLGIDVKVVPARVELGERLAGAGI